MTNTTISSIINNLSTISITDKQLPLNITSKILHHQLTAFNKIQQLKKPKYLIPGSPQTNSLHNRTEKILESLEHKISNLLQNTNNTHEFNRSNIYNTYFPSLIPHTLLEQPGSYHILPHQQQFLHPNYQ